MSRKHPELPEGYQPKGRWYYRVRAEGKKRVWVKISLIQHGLPAFYRALSEMAAKDIAPDRVPMLAVAWLKDRGDPSAENDEWAVREISKAFAEFRAREVTTPACIAFLKQWKDKDQARTYNLMRFSLHDLMRFAEGQEQDGVPFRDPGTNPVSSIKRMSTPARDRYPTSGGSSSMRWSAGRAAGGIAPSPAPGRCWHA
jgi:hypothetical protein